MAVSCNPDSAVCLSDLTKNIWQTSDGAPVVGVGDLTTPGGILTAAWPYMFAIAGLILFGMLLWGALEIQFGAADTKSAESGKKRITHAVIGFILLFSTFWMGQIIQQIFGLNFAVGQEVELTVPPAGGGEETPETPEPPAEPLEAFEISATNYGNQLRVCASSAQVLSEYPATVTSTIFKNGESVDQRSYSLQSGSTTRCATVASTAQVQQDMVRALNERVPGLAAAGVSWATEAQLDPGIPSRAWYNVVATLPNTLTFDMHQRLWDQVVALNSAGNQEIIRVEIGGVIHTFTITYRYDGVPNPGQ